MTLHGTGIYAYMTPPTTAMQANMSYILYTKGSMAGQDFSTHKIGRAQLQVAQAPCLDPPNLLSKPHPHYPSLGKN